MSEESALAQPYQHLLEGRDPVEVLRSTPARLNKVLGALSPEAIEHKPSEHRWSFREILCHLADCEVAWAWRLRQVYGADDPVLPSFEQDAWGTAYDGVGYTTEAARGTWSALRRWNLALIEGLTEEQKRRPARHPELGTITLWTIVEIAAGHDLHHIQSLEKVTSQLAS